MSPSLLLVDDDELLRTALSAVLRESGFEVTSAPNVVEALKLISLLPYDVLLTDLHMPGAGDGLTVVSAMRHANPSAVTLLLSAFPKLDAAVQAILMQADEILVKPMELTALVDVIKQRMAMGPARNREIQSVAAILERTSDAIIRLWFERIQTDKNVMSVAMDSSERSGHLPRLLRDLVHRLLCSTPIGSGEVPSSAAAAHGAKRRKQGYSADMLVGESRMLQVSIFETLQANLSRIDFSLVLIGVMTIADEIDSQLTQSMRSFIASSPSHVVAPI